MTALLALSLCGVCVVAVVGVYYSMPPVGARPNVYELALWMLLGTALEGAATALKAEAAFILGAVAKRSDITLAELQRKLKKRGTSAGIGTLWRFFRRHKITLKKRLRMPPSRAERT